VRVTDGGYTAGRARFALAHREAFDGLSERVFCYGQQRYRLARAWANRRAAAVAHPALEGERDRHWLRCDDHPPDGADRDAAGGC